MRGSRWLVLAAAALATIGCDRATKGAARVLLEGQPDRSYLSDTIRLGYAENTGGFLSLGADWSPIARAAVFTVGTGTALAVLLILAVRERSAGLSGLGVILFVAGGLSNWIDRVARGSVVDFLNLGVGSVRTGVFNVADVAIMVGAGLVAVAAFRKNHSSVDPANPTNRNS